jgi:hypothetical protein
MPVHRRHRSACRTNSTSASLAATQLIELAASACGRRYVVAVEERKRDRGKAAQKRQGGTEEAKHKRRGRALVERQGIRGEARHKRRGKA